MTNIINYWFNHCESASSLTLSEHGRVLSDSFGLKTHGSWGMLFRARWVLQASSLPSLGDPTLGNLCLEFWTCRKHGLSNFRIQDTLLCEEIFRRMTSKSSYVIGRFLLFTALYVYELIRASWPPCEVGKAGFWVHFISEDKGIKRTSGFKDLEQTALWVDNKRIFHSKCLEEPRANSSASSSLRYLQV